MVALYGVNEQVDVMRKKVVVTGGAGFIGSHLVKRLVRDGYEVVVVDNLCEGKKENLGKALKEVEFCQDDIRDVERLKKIFVGVDTVFHEAALRSVKRSVDNPLATNENNVTGTLNVLEAAREIRVRRVVSASSSSVYGKTEVKIFTEEMCANPQSPYALSKLAGEVYSRLYWELYGLQAVSLRYFNVFGPGQDPENQYAAVVPIFITKLMKDEAPTIHWDGDQSRDFTFIDNVVEANVQAMEAKNVGGEVLNVAAGKSYSINHLYGEIEKLVGRSLKPISAPKRAGDVRYTCGSGVKAEKLLGKTQKISFEKGLKQTVEWFEKQGRE